MKVRKKKVRGNSRFYICWLLVLGVVFFGVQWFLPRFKDASIFEIKDIHIRGNSLVNKEYLHSIAEQFKGVNIFEIDKEEISMSFQTISRVYSVNTLRIYPSRLIIRVNERKGVFFVKDNTGNFFPIDSGGYVLDVADWFLEEDLPLINIRLPRDQIVSGQRIEDPRVDYIFSIYDVLTSSNIDILRDISEFYFVNNDLYFVDMKSGCRVILGTENLREQIQRFIFLRNNQGFDRNSTVDLRFDARVIVTQNQSNRARSAT